MRELGNVVLIGEARGAEKDGDSVDLVRRAGGRRKGGWRESEKINVVSPPVRSRRRGYDGKGV